MFIVKSAFWLGLAFLLIQPQGVDFAAAGRAMSSGALVAGQRLITSQIAQPACRGTQCVGNAVLATAMSKLNDPSGVFPMQDSPDRGPVPIPRPRPARTR